MTSPAVNGCRFEFSRGIYTAVAVHAILHAEGFTAINILLHARPRGTHVRFSNVSARNSGIRARNSRSAVMAVIAIYTCSRVHAVMKNYMRRKHILVDPRFLGSRLHYGIQSLNSRLFRQRQAMAIHAVCLRGHKSAGLRFSTAVAIHASEPDGIPVKGVDKGNQRRGPEFHASTRRDPRLPQQKIRQEKPEQKHDDTTPEILQISTSSRQPIT